MRIPSTASRVHEHTHDSINQRIQRRTAQNVTRFGAAEPEALDRRLTELEHEWDVERALETNAAALAAVGAGLALLVDRRFALIPLVVGGFLLQHAIQGWCPPLPVFRRLGYRTPAEIAHERYALKALRGDFATVSARDDSAASQALGAAMS